ncbi:hypothetical protein [Litoreibacter roseus]|uniref:Uncharacterized protein n=1 Tax=Litoreibacter roseus TaxID=2601869 RepID=A0A6N6JFU2_9RHOB|nr:hypothetical protein [Litoreibacter roseus]GFE64082.1 hypothetical protein KIN_11560 [Litoreibacter roseus]
MNRWVKSGPLKQWVDFSNNAIDLIKGLVSVVTTLLAGLGITLNAVGNGGGSRSGPTVIDALQQASLPIRLAAFVIICTALGWGLGLLLAYMTRIRKDAWRVGSFFVAGIWGVLLVSSADMVTDPGYRGALPQLHFLTLIGLSIMLYLVTFEFRAHARYNTPDVMEQRSATILTFASVTLAMIALMEFA